MKKVFKPIYSISINWIFFLIYANNVMLNISDFFKLMDYNWHEGKYHYGPGFFSLTVILILFILSIIYNHISIKKGDYNKDGGYEYAVNMILVISFTIQSAIVLNYFGLP